MVMSCMVTITWKKQKIQCAKHRCGAVCKGCSLRACWPVDTIMQTAAESQEVKIAGKWQLLKKQNTTQCTCDMQLMQHMPEWATAEYHHKNSVSWWNLNKETTFKYSLFLYSHHRERLEVMTDLVPVSSFASWDEMSKRGTLQIQIKRTMSSLPPELLNIVFKFLPFHDLKNVLLVCRLAHIVTH